MNRFKAPDLKVPQMAKDLVADLRDRRLLPLVVLLVVAIIAAPLLLPDGSSSPPPPTAPVRLAGPPEARLTVARSDPGLRLPGKRLGYRRAKDPFKQQYTGPVFNPGSEPLEQATTPSSSNSSSTEVGSTSAPVTSGETAPPASPEGAEPAVPPHAKQTPSGPPSKSGSGTSSEKQTPPGSPSETGSGTSSEPTISTVTIDAKIVKTTTSEGGKPKSETFIREGLRSPGAMPGEKTPVVTYVGISAKTRYPLFLVSPEVSAIYGEAKCLSGTTSCQLVELEPTFPATFIFGPDHARYKINVTKVEPVVTGHS